MKESIRAAPRREGGALRGLWNAFMVRAGRDARPEGFFPRCGQGRKRDLRREPRGPLEAGARGSRAPPDPCGSAPPLPRSGSVQLGPSELRLEVRVLQDARADREQDVLLV